MDFTAYLLFLFFFTLAVMWPSCGNLVLDYIVFFWAVSIAVENIRITYLKYCDHRDRPMTGVLLGIGIEVIFLVLFLFIRIIGLWTFGTRHIAIAKAILSFGLIYYFYRVLYIYFPISSKFGPMMIRLQYMICDDFVTFLRLFVIFMISSGVAITAVLYPHHPLNWDLFSKAILFRGLMALFTSEMSDLKTSDGTCSINRTTGDHQMSACSALSRSYRYDSISTYRQYGISTPFCRQTSWIAWLLLIQYFFLAKRLLISLLTALFSVTGARIQRQSEQIWCYNQYAILVEYQNRLRLPPPFVIFSYIIESMMIICRQCKRCFEKRCTTNQATAPATTRNVRYVTVPMQSPTGTTDDAHSNEKQSNTISSNSETIEDKDSERKNEASIYWKHKAKDYFLQIQAAETAKDPSKGLVIGLSLSANDHLKCNSIANVQKDIEVLRRALLQSKDRLVSLEETMNNSNVLLEKISPIVFRVDQKFTEIPTKFLHIYSRQSPYVYTENARSWVGDKFVPWTINPFVQRNPSGRTGVQGRGAHIRWGANKSVIVIVTRWKKDEKEFVVLQGRPILETIIFIDENTKTCKFAEGKILGEESPYKAVCQMFNDLAFKDKNCECILPFRKENMIEFFESFARSNEFESHTFSRGEYRLLFIFSYSIETSLVGYIDDVRNTDNAWLEAEIWNFHYDSHVAFPSLRDDGTVLWTTLADNLNRVSIQTSILRRIARIHDASFD
ncbi:unnamed protein product [Adineta ricciae]|uniref:Uncharacterized protein n=1 Tax=Adineta ricciae TaxID=249248 RepID=A0A815TD75_ADIRI|nr:unnamed protein product [Adineta ricciae]